MELFTQLFGGLLLFVYHCFDRIVIHGYFSGLSRPEQVVHFFRQILGVPILSTEVLTQRTNDYQNWVEAFASNHHIPIEWAQKDVRKEDHVLPWLRRMRKKGSYGVYFIFKSMEQGPTFRISVPKYPTKDPNHRILEVARATAPAKRLRFKNKLFSLDATLVELCLQMFDWAKYRQTKGAIKLHVLLDHDGYLPVYAHVSEGNVPEIEIARALSLPKGSIVVIDRGYIDYKLFSRWTKEGIHFVTRLKENADYVVWENCPMPKGSNVTKDQLIGLNPFMAGAPCREDLRLVTVWDEENQREIQLLTNLLQLSAATISAIYKERWQIELFFKALKQSLKIKTFVGTSANAVRTQIWTALIAMLLIKILQQRSTFGWALSNLIALLRWNLFTYRCLWEWINRPFDTPPETPPDQLELFDLDSIPQPT